MRNALTLLLLLYAGFLHADEGSDFMDAYYYTRPSELTAEQIALLGRTSYISIEISLACTLVNRGGVINPGVGLEPFNDEDEQTLRAMLSLQDLTDRDMDLLIKSQFGTGMSFRAFKCMRNDASPEVNKSYYQGVGHKWQVILSGARYVYFEGDGTEMGMVITGWQGF